MVQALQRGEIDAALAWGPQAGWFAAQAQPPLRVRPLVAPPDAGVPFEFGIALAVRPGETAWRDRLQAALDARRAQVDALLAAWSVPRLASDATAATEAAR
jgi:mxaJ protein